MHGNINRADAHFNDTVDLTLINVRQRDVVAEQKRKAIIIILKIERFAHAGRQLVNEAEHALVAAGALPVHKICFKRKAQCAVLRLYEFLFAPLALRRFVYHMQMGVRLVKTEIENIRNVMPID